MAICTALIILIVFDCGPTRGVACWIFSTWLWHFCRRENNLLCLFTLLLLQFWTLTTRSRSPFQTTLEAPASCVSSLLGPARSSVKNSLVCSRLLGALRALFYVGVWRPAAVACFNTHNSRVEKFRRQSARSLQMHLKKSRNKPCFTKLDSIRKQTHSLPS